MRNRPTRPTAALGLLGALLLCGCPGSEAAGPDQEEAADRETRSEATDPATEPQPPEPVEPEPEEGIPSSGSETEAEPRQSTP